MRAPRRYRPARFWSSRGCSRCDNEPGAANDIAPPPALCLLRLCLLRLCLLRLCLLRLRLPTLRLPTPRLPTPRLPTPRLPTPRLPTPCLLALRSRGSAEGPVA